MEQHTAANVEMAVLQFYHQGASQQTHQWLQNAQLSPMAWNFSWELVQPDKKHEVQFFGASTIAIKVSKCWHEVPADQHVAVRKRVLELLTTYKGPRIVQTRLCVALASILIQSIPGQWENPVQELIQTFQGTVLLFEILTVIPEEFSTQAMPSTKRVAVRHELTSSLPYVLPLILNVLQSNNNGDVTVQAIKCLQAWVQFGIPMEETVPLVDRLLAAVQDEELFDSSLDTLSSIISHPDTHKYVNLLKGFLEKILQLEGFLAQLLNEGSYEMATPLVSLFVTFGETHSRMLIDWATECEPGKQYTVRLVRIIHAASSCNAQFPTQETISEMPFGFWYIFQDDMIACEPPQFQAAIATFGPIYEELVNSLMRKAMYSLNENEWTADQRETFRCYRTDIADTIMYCYNILRDNLLRLLLRHVDEATTQNLQDPNRNWPYLETCLYCWSAVAESLAEEEDVATEVLTQFLAKLPMLPYNNNMRVISSALDCIGGFAEWLAMHPDLLPHVTPIVLTALSSPEIALYATMALKDMSRDCAEGMKPYSEEIIVACHNALKSGQLKHGECVRLMYPIGKMLSLLPPPTILPKLEPILTPYLQEMQETVVQPPSPQTKAKITFHLKILMTLFQTLDIRRKDDEQAEAHQQSNLEHPQPISVIFPQIYPLIKKVAEVWIKEVEVMDTLSSVLKQVISTLLDDIKPFTQDIIMLLIHCYDTQPHSSTLELSRQFFVMYGNDQTMQPLIRSFLKRTVDRTMKELQSTGNPSDFADLVATFFQVLSQILKKSPSLLTHRDGQNDIDMVQLFQCGCGCLGFPESGPVKYACSFLANFVNVSRDQPPLNEIVNRHGEILFKNTMQCMCDSAASSFVDHYVDVLFALSKKYFDNLCQWLQALVNTDGFPSNNVTKEQKQHFATLILKERANKRKLQEIVREFSLACTGLAGTQQAVQMAQVLAAWDRVDAHKASTTGSVTIAPTSNK